MNKKKVKHKTSKEKGREMNIQREMQTSRLGSTVSQFMVTGPTLSGEKKGNY